MLPKNLYLLIGIINLELKIIINNKNHCGQPNILGLDNIQLISLEKQLVSHLPIYAKSLENSKNSAEFSYFRSWLGSLFNNIVALRALLKIEKKEVLNILETTSLSPDNLNNRSCHLYLQKYLFLADLNKNCIEHILLLFELQNIALDHIRMIDNMPITDFEEKFLWNVITSSQIMTNTLVTCYIKSKLNGQSQISEKNYGIILKNLSKILSSIDVSQKNEDLCNEIQNTFC